jgi:hypothetical protein
VGQIPYWEARSRLDIQEVSRLLWNSKFRHMVQMNPLLDPILYQMNPFYILTLCFFKIRFDIIEALCKIL